MLPTLACKSSSAPSAVDALLMRCMPRPSLRAIFSGDVVAFSSPLSPGSDSVLVRRVAAVEGDELVTDDASDGSFTIPEGGRLPQPWRLDQCMLSVHPSAGLGDDRSCSGTRRS